MSVRNTPSGYGLVTKSFHWITFVLMLIQFAVGYLITRIDDDNYESIPGMSEDRLFGMHMSVGATVLVLGVARLAWRILTPLPAWAPTLTRFERRYEHRIEQVLYFLMLAIPLSGMLAAMADGEDLAFFGVIEVPSFISEDSDLDDPALGLHIASHLAFFAAFALHVGLVLKHQLVDRDRLLGRML
jgi:cytochrome b561